MGTSPFGTGITLYYLRVDVYPWENPLEVEIGTEYGGLYCPVNW